MTVLRDPMWQFVGALLGLLAVVVSIYLFVLGRRQRSLSYDVLMSTPLLTVNEVLKGKIQITYEETPVQNVHLLILRIRNDGSTPITPDDFVEPLHFSFRDDLKILSTEVAETVPDSLRPKVITDASGFTISPLLLNGGDTVILKLLFAYPGGVLGLRIHTRIVGVSQIKSKPDVYRPYFLAGSLMMGIGMMGVVLMPLLMIYLRLYTAEVVAGMLGAVIVAGVGFIVGYLPIIRNSLKRVRARKYLATKTLDDDLSYH